jgi:hypothetical protein
MDALEEAAGIANVLDDVREDAHVVEVLFSQYVDIAADDASIGAEELAGAGAGVFGILDTGDGVAKAGGNREEVAGSASYLEEAPAVAAKAAFDQLKADGGSGLFEFGKVAAFAIVGVE